MHTAIRRTFAVILLIIASVCLPAHAQSQAAQPASPGTQTASELKWYKGNTHTHTLNSDGDSTPDEVVRWYREHGYQFLVLTDHNFLTSVDGLNALHGADERFLVVKGEEVTSLLGEKAIHVNGLDVARKVDQATGASVSEILQRNVDAIRAANGVPHINHPNFRWSVTLDELRQVRNNRLFEVFNGHPTVNNLGGGGVPGVEEAWDAILSSGVLLYGVAVDDAHTFKQPGNPNVAGPGRGWVVIRAARLEPRALVEALDRGDFYASNGVELDDLQVSAQRVQVTVKPAPSSKYRVQFIGKGGRVLSESIEPTATYEPKGNEGYVRTRVLESNGRQAWIQPVVIPPRGSGADPLASTAGVLALAAVLGMRARFSRRVPRYRNL